MAMSIDARANAYASVYTKWPASWPRRVDEQDRDVIYATWVLGNDYRTRSKLYGAYPHGYLDRVLALFPDVDRAQILHVFAGSVAADVWTRLDSKAERGADVIGNVYDCAALLRDRMPVGGYPLVLADPPYSSADAEKYGTPMVNRGKAMRAIADVTMPGGHLVWLDTVWPMHSKTQWVTVGRISVWRSTNHRLRACTIFQRVT